uniref:hypothetical protein n=1 Tax=Mesorhizobium sp. WSM4875 TaxID=3038539 RepID=UPI0024169D59|nr:hypothetical protein [Mesorhizobium sp. WSM4875]WIE94800.1 hypothetical protein P9270_030200 [Mesorhizobium sp. WSM4875]
MGAAKNPVALALNLYGVNISVALLPIAKSFWGLTSPSAVDSGAEFYVFGHLGDGNLHYHVTRL